MFFKKLFNRINDLENAVFTLKAKVKELKLNNQILSVTGNRYDYRITSDFFSRDDIKDLEKEGYSLADAYIDEYDNQHKIYIKKDTP